MPGLVPGIHALKQTKSKDVDGRDKKPGHDGWRVAGTSFRRLPFGAASAI